VIRAAREFGLILSQCKFAVEQTISHGLDVQRVIAGGNRGKCKVSPRIGSGAQFRVQQINANAGQRLATQGIHNHTANFGRSQVNGDDRREKRW